MASMLVPSMYECGVAYSDKSWSYMPNFMKVHELVQKLLQEQTNTQTSMTVS